jgi:hypothetical protein
MAQNKRRLKVVRTFMENKIHIKMLIMLTSYKYSWQIAMKAHDKQGLAENWGIRVQFVRI